jgi:hypothetical protein
MEDFVDAMELEGRGRTDNGAPRTNSAIVFGSAASLGD